MHPETSHDARIAALEAEIAHLRARHGDEVRAHARVAERLASLLAALPAAVVVLDGQGRIDESNPAAQSLLGAPLNGTFWREVAARAFRPEPHGADLALNDGRLVTLTTCPRGHEPGQILMLQEVTSARDLQQRLEHSRRLADMGRMAASLAHQVRTPLASALLYVSQLTHPALAEPRRTEFAAKAQARLRDLERLVNDMLAFARGDVGQGESIDPDVLLCAVAESVGDPDTRGLRLKVRHDAVAATLRGNPTLLRTALLNLINNAAQAGAREVQISTRAAPPDAVDLLVRDDGPGLSEAVRDRVFEPFATTRADGAGLGLAVVRAVARAHGGEAWYEPAPGGGSLFGLRLPAHYAELRRVGT